MSEQQHTLQLISFDICPYVERSRIVLHEKSLAFDQKFVDLSNKPDWLFKVSPRGKVPVLLIDDRPVFESTIINELLDELYPATPMLPKDPLDRAEARAWIAFNDGELMNAAASLWFSSNKAKRDRAAEQLRTGLARVEEHLAQRPEQHTFFSGDTIGLIDAVYAPLFTRWGVMEHLGYDDILENMPHVQTYTKNLLAAPSVQKSQAENLVSAIVEYLEKRSG